VDFKAILTTPFRPRKGFEALSGKMSWVWIPCLVFLLLTLLARVTVETPRQIAFQNAAIKAATEKATAEMQSSGAPTSDVKGSTGADTGDAPVPVDGEVIVPEDAGLADSAQSVVWVSMTALAFVPYGVRDLVQSAYMTLADTYVRHPGLSSFAAPKDPLASGGIVYGLLGLADIWTAWATVLLYVGLRFGIGLERKRAVIAWGVFIAAVLVMRIVAGGIVQAFFTVV
jgi:hypothetical protein